MQTQITLTDRRSIIGRSIQNLTNRPGALSRSESQSLNDLHRELRDLENSIQEESDRNTFTEFRAALHNGLQFNKYAREKRVIDEAGLGTGIATGAGTTVPVQFEASVLSAMKWGGPMVDPDVTTILPTETGGSRAYPTDADSATSIGTIVGEGQQAPLQETLNLGQVILKNYKVHSGLVGMSTELVQDFGIDVSAYLSRIFGVRNGRALNQLFTTGTGVNQPTGWVTSTVAAGNVITAAGAFSNDGTSGPNVPGSDDLSALETSLDYAYRRDAKWMMHQTTMAGLRKLKDKNGRPVFDIQDGKLWGHEILINNAMDSPQKLASSPPVTKNVIGFGDWKRFMVRTIPSVLAMYDERFALASVIAYALWTRADGALADASAVSLLQTVY